MTDEERREQVERAKKYERNAFAFSPSDVRASLVNIHSILPPKWRDYPHLGMVALLFIAGIFYSFIALHYPLQRCDDIYYWVGARGIAMGQGYADITRPDMPLLTKYVPLASFFNAPFVILVSFSLAKMRFVNIFYLLLGSFFCYKILFRRVSKRVALSCMILFLFHQTLIQLVCLQGNIPLQMILVWLIIEGMETQIERMPRRKFAAIMGLILGVSFYDHRIFIVAVLATILLLLLKKRGGDLGIILPIYGILVFPWMLRSYRASGHWISPEYEGEISERIQTANISHNTSNNVQTTVEHILVNLKDIPFELGHRLFPWSRPTFGNTWPLLENHGLGWLSPLSIYVIFILVVIGFLYEIINKSKQKPPIAFTELYVLGQCGILLVFFFSLNYFSAFLPWLYLYLLRGTQYVLHRAGVMIEKWNSPVVTSKIIKTQILKAGWLSILLVLLAKDIVVYVLPRGGTTAQSLRWHWITQNTSPDATIYYEGLDNYALSQWRYLDTERYSIGLTTKQIQEKLEDTTSNRQDIHYLCVARSSSLNPLLRQKSWKPLIEEAEEIGFDKDKLLLSSGFLTPAQREYIQQMEPPQRLWFKK